MKLEELKIFQTKTKKQKTNIDISPRWKKRNARVGIIKWCCCLQRSEVQETAIERSTTLPKNAYYEELKPISEVDKEYTTNIKVTANLYSMIDMKLVPTARKVITRNR